MSFTYFGGVLWLYDLSFGFSGIFLEAYGINLHIKFDKKNLILRKFIGISDVKWLVLFLKDSVSCVLTLYKVST